MSLQLNHNHSFESCFDFSINDNGDSDDDNVKDSKIFESTDNDMIAGIVVMTMISRSEAVCIDCMSSVPGDDDEDSDDDDDNF